jgi:hypothetical protein
MKCCNPNVANHLRPNIVNLQRRAADFIDYVCSRRCLPRRYRTFPLAAPPPPVELADRWFEIALNNSGVAATPRGQPADWRTNPPVPPSPPAHPKSTSCARPPYDKWFNSAAAVVNAPFRTYGRAQKFLNLLVKYQYCVARSGVEFPPNYHNPAWTLDYECALHAPIDRQVLQRLKSAWCRTSSWPLIQPIICNDSQLKAWSNLNLDEYRKILCLLRCMVNAANHQVQTCGDDAFGLFCNCNHSQAKIPKNDFVQAVRAIIGELDEDDPLVSVLDLEMRGLWNP